MIHKPDNELMTQFQEEFGDLLCACDGRGTRGVAGDALQTCAQIQAGRRCGKSCCQPEDFYNFDETGFAMGLISAQKVVTLTECYGRRSILQP